MGVDDNGGGSLYMGKRNICAVFVTSVNLKTAPKII